MGKLPGGCQFSLLLLLHTLSTLGNAKGGYWMDSVTQALIATYAGAVVPKLIGGTSVADAFFGGDINLAAFFFIWYLHQQDFFGLWAKVQAAGGDALGNTLNLGSHVFTTNLIIANAATGGLIQGTVMGVVAGTAASFFPLNQGIRFRRSAAHDHAFACSFFVAGGGFQVFDTVLKSLTCCVPALSDALSKIAVGATVDGLISTHLGLTASQFVLLATVLNHVFGKHMPDLGVPMGEGFDAFGVKDRVSQLLRL